MYNTVYSISKSGSHKDLSSHSMARTLIYVTVAYNLAWTLSVTDASCTMTHFDIIGGTFVIVFWLSYVFSSARLRHPFYLTPNVSPTSEDWCAASHVGSFVWQLCAAFNQFPIFEFLNLLMTRKKNEIVYFPLDRSPLSCKLSKICVKLAPPMYSNQIARIITKANYVEYVISITSLNQSNASLYSLWLTSLTVIRHRNPNHYTPLDVNSALHSHT